MAANFQEKGRTEEHVELHQEYANNKIQTKENYKWNNPGSSTDKFQEKDKRVVPGWLNQRSMWLSLRVMSFAPHWV